MRLLHGHLKYIGRIFTVAVEVLLGLSPVMWLKSCEFIELLDVFEKITFFLP